MSWIANVKGAEHTEGFANAEAALDFVAEAYKSDVSRDTDLIRSAYSQVEDIEIDGYFAGATWHICRPLTKTSLSSNKVNPLVGLIKSPEEILRDRKDRFLTKTLDIINQQLANNYHGQTDAIVVELRHALDNDSEYDLIADELQEILMHKRWNILEAKDRTIKLLPF